MIDRNNHDKRKIVFKHGTVLVGAHSARPKSAIHTKCLPENCALFRAHTVRPYNYHLFIVQFVYWNLDRKMSLEPRKTLY